MFTRDIISVSAAILMCNIHAYLNYCTIFPDDMLPSLICICGVLKHSSLAPAFCH